MKYLNKSFSKKTEEVLTKGFKPIIDYFINKGAKSLYIDFYEEDRCLSFYTPDIILSVEEMKELMDKTKFFEGLCKKRIATSDVGRYEK